MSNFSDADGADGDDTSESGGEHPLTQYTAPFKDRTYLEYVLVVLLVVHS